MADHQPDPQEILHLDPDVRGCNCVCSAPCCFDGKSTCLCSACGHNAVAKDGSQP